MKKPMPHEEITNAYRQQPFNFAPRAEPPAPLPPAPCIDPPMTRDRYTRTLKVSDIALHTPYRKTRFTPYIRLKGNWLEQAGFAAQSHVTVTVPRRGQLIITIS